MWGSDERLATEDGDLLRKQPAESRLKRWLLLDGNRLVIAGLVLVAAAATSYAGGRLGLIAVRPADPATQLFHGLIIGNVTVIGLVITINQLVLSWEFGAPDNLRQRVTAVREFRQDVEDAADMAVSPAEPTAFLQVIIDTLRGHAHSIERMADEAPNDATHERIVVYADIVDEYTDRMEDVLDRTQFGTFTALSAMLNYNDAWQLHAARRFRHERAADISDEAVATFDDMIEILELFRVARAYFKTLYMEQELAELSRVLLYVGLPALFVAGMGMLFSGAAARTVPSEVMLAVVSIAGAAAATPIAVLAAYALRIATVASRTPSIGSFHTGQERSVEQASE